MRLFVAVLAAVLAAAEARGQTPPVPTPNPPQSTPAGPVSLPATICGLQVPPPAKQPPAGSGPLTFAILPCFEKQGGIPVIEANTYLYYMELANRVSRPSEDRWVPYNEDTERAILADFKRLWATNFLDDLSIRTVIV